MNYYDNTMSITKRKTTYCDNTMSITKRKSTLDIDNVNLRLITDKGSHHDNNLTQLI